MRGRQRQGRPLGIHAARPSACTGRSRGGRRAEEGGADGVELCIRAIGSLVEAEGGRTAGEGRVTAGLTGNGDAADRTEADLVGKDAAEDIGPGFGGAGDGHIRAITLKGAGVTGVRVVAGIPST